MKVKKRAVWFLTLLSLAAVISVYYLTDQAAKPFDGLAIFSDDTMENTALNENAAAEDGQTPVFAQSYLFEELRMEVQNQRSELNEQLTTKIMSDDLTAEEKNDAWSQMEEMSRKASGEAMLELLITSLGYPDAFVKIDDGKVTVRVIAEDGFSKAQANDIIYTVKSEWAEAALVEVTPEN
ncbi:SpoIIIAH-like family protein [Chungangia koreensis]|uniref:SpoIIIAH-like family protein n=1 Tax=Chungangia koreensis TaxID=752657 RepID=A0ABV8X6X5_9LACT